MNFFFVTVSDIKKDPKPDGCKRILKFNLSKLNVSVGRRFWLEVDKNLSDNYGKSSCPMLLLYYLVLPSGELPLLGSQGYWKAKPKECQQSIKYMVIVKIIEIKALMFLKPPLTFDTQRYLY